MDDIEEFFINSFSNEEISGVIERNEKREQKDIVESQRLPSKTNDYSIPIEIRKVGITDEMEANNQWEDIFNTEKKNNRKWTKEQYEKMGIKILGEYDDLFLDVELPKGWKVKETSHSMWNDVLDDKGRKRISFFYKGSFYDREAFTNFERRFNASIIPFDEYKTKATYEDRKEREWYGIVTDCGNEIFRTEGLYDKDFDVYYEKNEKLQEYCTNYLNENYPMWENFDEYWN